MTSPDLVDEFSDPSFASFWWFSSLFSKDSDAIFLALSSALTSSVSIFISSLTDFESEACPDESELSGSSSVLRCSWGGLGPT